MEKFFGKYRGMVVNNMDPMKLGRVQVQVPDVTSLTPGTWAMPCFPVTGKQMGFWSLPQVGTGIFVEFEQGNPDFPIWSGCWYGSAADVPSQALATQPPLSSFFVQTAAGHVLVLSDMPGPSGGILLKTANGAMIAINETGITISNGNGATISLSGPTVDMNSGALSVT